MFDLKKDRFQNINLLDLDVSHKLMNNINKHNNLFSCCECQSFGYILI